MKYSEISKVIKIALDQDQTDRKSETINKLPLKKKWKVIGANDKKRQRLISSVLKQKPKLKAIDYFRAGIIFHHSNDIESLKIAKKLAKRGAELNNKSAEWLYAAVSDRILVIQGKKQIFGTQFIKNKGDKWELYPVRIKTTDKERSRYNVLPLKKIQKRIELLNSPNGKKALRSSRLGFTRVT